MRSIFFICKIVILISCKQPTAPQTSDNNSASQKILILYKQGKNKDSTVEKRLSSLNKTLVLAKKNDTLLSDVLYSLASLHFTRKEYDSVYYYGKLLKGQKNKNRDYVSLGKYYHLLAYYHDMVNSDADSSFFYHNLAKKQFEKINDSLNIGRRLLSMGIIQGNQNDFFGSKETLTEALTYLQTSGDKRFLASVYNELATNHRKLINYKDAILYYNKAVTVAKGLPSEPIFQNNLAATFIDAKKYTSAIKLLSEISNSAQLDPTQKARVLDNLAYAKWLKNQKVDVSSFIAPLSIRKQKNDKRGQIASYTHLGEYFSITDPVRAKKYLDTVLQIARQIKSPRAEQDALRFLMNLKPKDIDIRNRYVFLQDSLYRVGLQVKTQFAKMKYDDEQMQLSILRLEAETERKNTELARRQTQSILFLALSILLVLGTGFLVYYLKQRHRKEKLREIYRTEKRIAQDLHDNLSNDLFGLMADIQNNKSDRSTILSYLDEIYQTTREISHKNAEVGTGDKFKDELLYLIETYQNKDTSIIVKGFSNITWQNLGEDKCVTIHRCIKELLVNMKKHADASLVSFQFKEDKKTITIIYSDNGIGISQINTPETGVGLKNMTSRLQSIGGSIHIHPNEGNGTTIELSLS